MNIAYSYDVWLRLISLCNTHLSTTVTKYNSAGTSFWMGYPVLYSKDRVIIFKQCEYCKSEDGKIYIGRYDTGYYCNHCGAPITYKERGKL